MAAERVPAYLCDGVRTPFGRYGGALSAVRTDDLAALPLRALQQRNPGVDWSCIDDVYYGCANQAGEDNRNVARMAALLAGLPENVPACTLNACAVPASTRRSRPPARLRAEPAIW